MRAEPTIGRCAGGMSAICACASATLVGLRGGSGTSAGSGSCGRAGGSGTAAACGSGALCGVSTCWVLTGTGGALGVDAGACDAGSELVISALFMPSTILARLALSSGAGAALATRMRFSLQSRTPSEMSSGAGKRLIFARQRAKSRLHQRG